MQAINAVAKRYRYTGKERDEESGLYYHGARYYIPWLCRWTAIDPMESKYAGMSPYNYSFNNPVMFNDLNGADAGDPPKDGDIRLENGIEYMYSTSPDQNGQASWGELPPTFTVSAQAIPAIIDDGLAQYSNNVKLSAELMTSQLPIVDQEPFSIRIVPGQIPYEIKRVGVKLTHPTPVIDRGPTEYEERQRAYVKYQINKLKASHGNPAIGALSFAADDVMGTADAFYDSYVNYSEGNLGTGTVQLGFGLLAASGYAGSTVRTISKGAVTATREINSLSKAAVQIEEATTSTIKLNWDDLYGVSKNAKWVSPKQGVDGPGLRHHFGKHGNEVGTTKARDYDLSARITIQNGKKFSYRDPTSNQMRIGYWDESTGFFTGTAQNRKTATILTHFPLSWDKIKKFPGFPIK